MKFNLTPKYDLAIKIKDKRGLIKLSVISYRNLNILNSLMELEDLYGWLIAKNEYRFIFNPIYSRYEISKLLNELYCIKWIGKIDLMNDLGIEVRGVINTELDNPLNEGEVRFYSGSTISYNFDMVQLMNSIPVGNEKHIEPDAFSNFIEGNQFGINLGNDNSEELED